MSQCSFSTFISNWQTLYAGQPCPNRKYMHRLLIKFRAFGDLKNTKRSRQRPVRNNDNVTSVSAYYQLKPGTSLRNFIDEGNLDMSLSSLRNILKDDLGLKPYKCRKFHKLNGRSDFDQRYFMCKTFLESIRNDSSLLSNILWTDECFLKINGVQNHHNIYWWGSENPHIFVEQQVNAKGVMVFVGITSWGPVGPFFFDELLTNSGKRNKNSVNGDSYTELLKTKVIPELSELFPRDVVDKFIYQLDGAPGHRTASVIRCLNENFPSRWWGNRGPMHWAPRSPDLTPLDFSFWGCLRHNVYKHRPNTLIELKQVIKEEVKKFSLDYFQKICLDTVPTRMEECRKSSGQTIEPFLK